MLSVVSFLQFYKSYYYSNDENIFSTYRFSYFFPYILSPTYSKVLLFLPLTNLMILLLYFHLGLIYVNLF